MLPGAAVIAALIGLVLSWFSGAPIDPRDAFAMLQDPAPRADADLPRNEDAILAAGLAVETACVPWTSAACAPVQTVTAPSPGPMLLVLHDNEDAAFDAGIRAIAQFGGTLIALESGERRRHDGVDPNRVFGRDGYAPFTAWVDALNAPGEPVIALHNNKDGHGAERGVISVLRWLSGTAIRSFDHGSDEDNLVWMAGTAPLEQNALAGTLRAHLERLRINFVYETVDTNRDYSLSNHAALQDQPYYNVEAEHGALLAQTDMLSVLLTFLGFDSRTRPSV